MLVGTAGGTTGVATVFRLATGAEALAFDARFADVALFVGGALDLRSADTALANLSFRAVSRRAALGTAGIAALLALATGFLAHALVTESADSAIFVAFALQDPSRTLAEMAGSDDATERTAHQSFERAASGHACRQRSGKSIERLSVHAFPSTMFDARRPEV